MKSKVCPVCYSPLNFNGSCPICAQRERISKKKQSRKNKYTDKQLHKNKK